ncbi:hypothetical protein ACF0H5_001425 [Mactra antiquata]
MCAAPGVCYHGVSSVLRCSQCVSGVNGQCMTTAPQPTPCESRVNGTGPVHCMIAIRTDKTGTLVTFSRGCTGVILPKSGCREQADNTTLCYLICSIDSCNSAETFHSSFNFQLSYKNILIISLLFIFKFVVT